MKKRLFITSLILFVALVAGLGIHYALSLHKVTFSLESSTDTITVYTSAEKKIEQLTSSGQLLLQEGNYYIIPEGENIVSDKMEFTVGNDDMTISVNPPYTKDFLDTRLKEERSAIQAAVTAKYPSLINKYTLSQGSLYKQGDWFGGLLKPKVSDIRQQKDPYRIILHKKDGIWQVVRRPEYILTSSRYEEVPIDILRKVNAVVGEPGN